MTRTLARRAAPFVLEPGRALLAVWKRLPGGAFDLRCDLNLYPRPSYAYGVQQAAVLASRLGHPAISVIEFGVAGGNGLVALEQMAAKASAAYGVEIEVYGFDRAKGLPEPLDHRDLPYTWRESFFEMDVERLEQRLGGAKLVLGDIAETVAAFVDDHDPAPIGFVSIDVDYYSSTVDALRLFDEAHSRFLPRVFVYFDDLVGDDQTLQCADVGELRAIAEFNEAHDAMTLAPINGLRHKRPIPAQWNDAMYALHRFEHPDYGTYVGPDQSEQQLALRDP